MDKNQEILDLIKNEKELLKEGAEALDNGEFTDEDRDYFKEQKQISRVATDYATTTEMLALLLLQLIQERNKLIFLLFRKDVLSKGLEEKFRKAISIEDARKYYEDEKAKTDTVYEERNKQFAEFKKEQDRMEIFKAVLNGMSVEKAEKRLAEYNEQMKKAIQGQQGQQGH